MDARLKARLIITVAIWLLLAVLLALALSGIVPALADGPEPQDDELVPRAWLPTVGKAHTETGTDASIYVDTPLAVVQTGTPFWAELRIRDAENVYRWDGQWVWGGSLRFLEGHYGDLWSATVAMNEREDVSAHRVSMGQWALLPANADDALLYDSVFVTEQADGWFTVAGTVEIGDRFWRVVKQFHVMQCLTDYDGDGKRTVYDLQRVIAAVGSSDFNPLYDLDGDGAVTELDVLIAVTFQQVPCPSP